jgi:hypothetical protein
MSRKLMEKDNTIAATAETGDWAYIRTGLPILRTHSPMASNGLRLVRLLKCLDLLLCELQMDAS